MSETESVCPSCHTPLQRVASKAGMRFQCPACTGVAIALAVFRHVLVAGIGSQVWMASASQPANGAPCGFCTRAMRPTAVPGEGDHSATVEVCRVCETIWVPGDQAALLPMVATASGGALTVPAPPTRCPECGAPFKVAADGCCPYCHRVVEQQPEVIIVHDDFGPRGPGHGGGATQTIVGAAAGIALSILLGG
jgi:hypothetical protein